MFSLLQSCKVGRKKRNEIYWSCKLESSQVGPIWKGLSGRAFELLMKYKKPQHYIPVPRCEQAQWIGAWSSQGPNGLERAQKLKEQKMEQFPWNMEISSPSNLSSRRGEGCLWTCPEPFLPLPGLAETFHVEEESQDERNWQERGFTQLRESRTILSDAVGDPSNTEPPGLLSASSSAEQRGCNIELINN